MSLTRLFLGPCLISLSLSHLSIAFADTKPIYGFQLVGTDSSDRGSEILTIERTERGIELRLRSPTSGFEKSSFFQMPEEYFLRSQWMEESDFHIQTDKALQSKTQVFPVEEHVNLTKASADPGAINTSDSRFTDLLIGHLNGNQLEWDRILEISPQFKDQSIINRKNVLKTQYKKLFRASLFKALPVMVIAGGIVGGGLYTLFTDKDPDLWKKKMGFLGVLLWFGWKHLKGTISTLGGAFHASRFLFSPDRLAKQALKDIENLSPHDQEDLIKAYLIQQKIWDEAGDSEDISKQWSGLKQLKAEAALVDIPRLALAAAIEDQARLSLFDQKSAKPWNERIREGIYALESLLFLERINLVGTLGRASKMEFSNEFKQQIDVPMESLEPTYRFLENELNESHKTACQLVTAE